MPDYKKDFPLLAGSDVIYLDNAATTQRPAQVLEAERRFYETKNANPLRGLYDLAVEATEEYESARKTVRDFIGAKSEQEIIFTRNATESINLVAYSYALSTLKPGDEILITIMEHHSNILPWQMAARQTGATLRFLECERDGTITEEMIAAAVNAHTKIAAMAHISNVLGRRNPVEALIRRVHAVGGVVLIDAAQSAPHTPVNAAELDADFLAFSGHKMYAPMGIGVLYAKRELLEKMPPFLTGGEMIEYVTRESATWAELPHKFEAGTVNAGGAVALKAAIEYIRSIGFDTIEARERELTRLAMEEMAKVPHVQIMGSQEPEEHCGIISFTIDGVHPHDIATILSEDKVAIRAGHHCAQPLLKYLGVMSTARASIAFYNSEEDILRFLGSLKKIRKLMGYED
ncbi:MAG: SufS family cysteine desulfurase [Lachnospiraceae bacterium]|nr:SufS family cysteine desulfurase [Lachnospiraceae bacterium]